jgi:tetratricopeptide (TPR) repeat protein
VLSELARCLRLEGKLTVAEYLLRQALAKIDTLIMQQPGTQVFIRLRRVLLSDLGDILRTQGQYLQAKESYEEVLKLTTQIEGKYMHA